MKSLKLFLGIIYIYIKTEKIPENIQKYVEEYFKTMG